MEFFSGEGCLALPKLNLQFLTLHDYLLRNFVLFRLESTCRCGSTLCVWCCSDWLTLCVPQMRSDKMWRMLSAGSSHGALHRTTQTTSGTSIR